MRTSVAFSLLFSFILLAAVATNFAVDYAESVAVRSLFRRQLAFQIQGKVAQLVKDVAESVILPAREPQMYDSFLRQFDVPMNGYSPDALVEIFNAHKSISGVMESFDIESVGFIMYVDVEDLDLHDESSDSGSDGGTKRVYTWEVSVYPGCVDYVYSYVDSSNWPALYGVCGWRNGTITGPQVFTKPVPPLDPIEVAMFSNASVYPTGAFLPIANSWIDPLDYTLVYAMPYRDPRTGAVYAITYAEKNIRQISAMIHDSDFISEVDFSGAMFSIIDVTSNRIVAWSLAKYDIVDSNGTRIIFTSGNSTEHAYVMSYLKSVAGKSGLNYFKRSMVIEMPGDERYVIYTQRFSDAGGLDWLLVFAVPTESIYGDMKQRANTVVIVFFIVLFVGVLLVCTSVRCCVTGPIQYILSKGKRGKVLPSSLFFLEEIQELSNSVKSSSASEKMDDFVELVTSVGQTDPEALRHEQ